MSFKRTSYEHVRLILICGLLSVFLSCSASPPKRSNPRLVREETSVTFGGINESWRIEWLIPPKEACAPKDEEAQTCPCAGFAYAEYGQADLVRTREGKEIERFPLASLFEEQEKPVDNTTAVIQRWATDDEDFLSVNPPSAESIRKRPSVKIMNVADYNHDGSASEFILQVGTLPCFHRQSILVGISPDKPRLHAFGTIKSPNKPLVLEPEAWEQLRKTPRHVRYISRKCGDHAAGEQTEFVLSIEPKGIRAFEETFECTANDKKEKRVERVEL
jgi:hypothetical protein